jgi:hypothetical protein
MSPLTLFLAKLIGALLFFVGASMSLRKREITDITNRVIHDPAMIFFTAMLRLVAGLALVLGHDVWSGGALPVVVTLFGWLLFVSGLALLFIPHAKLVETYNALHFEKNYAVFAGVTIAVGAYLLIAGFVG